MRGETCDNKSWPWSANSMTVFIKSRSRAAPIYEYYVSYLTYMYCTWAYIYEHMYELQIPLKFHMSPILYNRTKPHR